MFNSILEIFKPKKSFFSYKNLVVIFVTLVSCFILVTSIWIKRKFGDISFEGILFTVQASLDGVPNRLVFSYIKRIFVILFYTYIITSILLYVYSLIAKRYLRMMIICISLVIIFIGSLYISSKQFNNINLLFQREYTQFIENNYAKIDKNLPINSKKKKNLIYIVLESIEGTFVYDKYGFSYMKNLENISKNNVSFKNQFQIFGAGLTISAFTAQLFGLPLNLPIGVNEYGNLEKFLPNAVSSLDLLDSNNYNIAFILGSDSRFSGFDNLFKYHSINYKIYDSNEFRKEPEYDKYYDSNGWGFIDSFIYEKSKAIILEQSRKDTNFVTIIMTIDTHNPVRVIGDYPRVYGDQRDAFVEADHRVGEFLNWLKRQPFYEDTVIVILGDHLFPKNKIGQAILPKEPKRSIFNVFINSGFDVSKDKQLKTCSTIDIAPTILEAIGFSLPDRKFGLGVSLFSDQPTLLEIYGEDELNEELSKNSKLYESFLY